MNRRKFLKLTAGATIALPAVQLASGSHVVELPDQVLEEQQVVDEAEVPKQDRSNWVQAGRFRMIQEYDITRDRDIARIDCATKRHHYSVAFDLGHADDAEITLAAAIAELRRGMQGRIVESDLVYLPVPDHFEAERCKLFDRLEDIVV